LMFMGAIVKDLERKSVESSSACGWCLEARG
jgi:hypothetical protein